MSNKIKILDEVTVSKIAAGEIIERPASIVKELIENSIDAKSKNIVIEIRSGGKSYIRVTDDGVGINEDEIEFAFLRHSTSKISTAEDLLNIHSLGFRGEALASISMTCKMETLTRSVDSNKGIRVFLGEGKIIKKETVGSPTGTTMIARDLFYNVPVRKKFLKSNLIESNHISDVIYKLALGNPDISFKYIKDSKMILKTPGNNDIKSNIFSILGKDYVNNLFEIDYCEDKFSIKGYMSKNDFYRGNRGHQYIFVNDRWIENKVLTETIEASYKSLIPINRFPIFILFIEIEPNLIDVNIHPTKQEIKLSNQDKVNNVLEQLVNRKLKEIVSIPKVKLDKKNDKNLEEINFLDIKKKENLPQDIIDKGKKSDNNTMLRSIYFKKDINSNEKQHNMYRLKEAENNLTMEKPKEDKKENLSNIFKNAKLVGILFNTYIILEKPLDNFFYVLDQHAAHERVNMRNIRKNMRQRTLVSKNYYLQRLFS